MNSVLGNFFDFIYILCLYLSSLALYNFVYIICNIWYYLHWWYLLFRIMFTLSQFQNFYMYRLFYTILHWLHTYFWCTCIVFLINLRLSNKSLPIKVSWHLRRQFFFYIHLIVYCYHHYKSSRYFKNILTTYFSVFEFIFYLLIYKF